MSSYLFRDIVIGEEGLLKGPFGSDLKKELYVPKSDSTYKVYLQENILKEDNNVGEHYISEEYYNEKMSRYAIKEGDFIVTCDGTLGEIFQLKNITEKGIISSSLLRITLNNEIVDDNYFYYLFKAIIKRQLIMQGNNSVLKHLPGLEVIRNHIIELPDLGIQKKVGLVLKNIDEKIKSNRAINAELESMARTVYDYWFLQFEFPNEEGKPYKTSGGKMVWNEELKREIPEGWEVKKVSDFLDVVTGKEDANHSTENGIYPFFTCSNEILKCDDYKFEGKSVLIAGNGNFNVKYYDGQFNAYQRTYILLPRDDKYIGVIYQNAIRTINKFLNNSNGSIVKFIKKEDVENITITVPSDEKLLLVFNEMLETIDHNKKENQELASLRDFLLPLLMNGQVGFKE